MRRTTRWRIPGPVRRTTRSRPETSAWRGSARREACASERQDRRAVEVAELEQRATRRDASDLATDRRDVGGDREAGEPVVVMAQHDAPRAQQLDAAPDELREAALDRLAIDVAAPGRGDDRDVGTEDAEHVGPVPRRVLVEDAAAGCLEHVEERPAVTAGTLVTRHQVFQHRAAEPG